jgi:N-acyl-D-amino-acid deacylase
MITKLCDGTVVDPVEGSYAGDVIIDGERIAAIEPAPTGGRLGEPEDVAAAGLAATADRVIDAAGLLIMPGGIDAHSHADARVFDEDVQLALLRSGVTSIIAGQDGVSFAPGDGRYATEYFGPLNGIHPSYRGGGVGRLLDTWDGATRLNVGYLVPAGTVRYEVLGRRRRQPGDAELAAMVDLVRAGMSQGALGLSSGLDYVPGTFAGEAELAALCAPVAEAGGRYVSHIRGYEEDAPAAFEELINICRRSGAAGHVSHLHARPDLIAGLLERAGECGVDVSWDAYPYDRSFTLLSTALLPPELIMLGNEGAARRLREPAMIDRLTQTIGAGIWRTDQEAGLTGPGSSWAERAYVARAGTQAAASLEGYSLAEAGRRCGIDPIRLGLQLLADSGLTTTAVVRIARPRTDDQLAQQFRLPGACSGSDGIYLGGMPHPRGYGTSARMLSQFGRLRRDFNWPELAAITSGNAALRFGLGDRGRVTAGAIADLALVDPHHVADRADYGGPRRLSTGIAQVFVSGHQVLADGQLTGRLAGCALRGGSR